VNIINCLIKKFTINTEIFLDTDLGTNFGVSNQRNLAICKKLNATHYLSGTGAQSYNDLNLFKKNTIELVYQDFVHPEYQQNSSSFISGLSILDVIFNCGFEETEKLLKKS